MKVTVKYDPQDDEDEELETSFSLTLPKGWLSGPTEKLRHLFVDQFNKKHGDAALPLNKSDCRLESKAGKVLPDDVHIDTQITEGEELYVRRGKDSNSSTTTVPKKQSEGQSAAPPKPTTSAAATAPSASNNNSEGPKMVPCKRFGCGKKFVPGQASEPCKHHKKPPVFHETRKYWACCPDKVAWDWDSFQAIEGCESLPEHSNETDAGTKKVMGGTELRAEINGPRELGEKKLGGLDKLLALRASLVQIGVKGEVFDAARDSIKRLHEDAEGKNVWDKVCSEMSIVFDEALSRAGAKQ